MANTAQLKQVYAEQIAPALQKQFNYGSKMEIPVLKKIVINQGLGDATQDKKIIEVAINEISTICGQKAVATYSKKDIANFKLRKKMPIGVMVTLRRERMYEFLEKLVRVALPRIRDFKGIESKFDGRGNYTLGIQEQIIFYRFSRPYPGYEHHLRYLCQDRRGRFRPAEGFRSPIQEQ